MEKIILFVLSAVLLFSDDIELAQCNECHNNYLAPPYKKVYKHYLLKYSSKVRIEKAMIDFLKAPAREKSAMPDGMKRRFDPSEHPVFDDDTIRKASRYIAKQEDVINRFK